MAEGEQRVSYEKNEKVQNCGTFTLEKEDHTVGNLLRQQMLTNPKVRFAAYQMPHPLQHKMLIRVQVCVCVCVCWLRHI